MKKVPTFLVFYILHMIGKYLRLTNFSFRFFFLITLHGVLMSASVMIRNYQKEGVNLSVYLVQINFTPV